MGQAIMLGSLLGLTALTVGLVLRFDPEAKRPAKRSADGDREKGEQEG